MLQSVAGSVNLSPRAAVDAPDLIEGTRRGEHSHHPGLPGIYAREEQQRPRRFLGREHRKVRKGPHRAVENGELRPLVRDPPRLSGGQRVRLYEPTGAHHLVPRLLKLRSYPLLDAEDDAEGS